MIRGCFLLRELCVSAAKTFPRLGNGAAVGYEGGRMKAVTRKFLAAVVLAGGLAGTACAGLLGTDYNNIEYLCCNWGPAMILPTQTNAAANWWIV